MKASIYATEGKTAYQFGNSRTLVAIRGNVMSSQFQKKENGEWKNGRNSYADGLVAKVKLLLSK